MTSPHASYQSWLRERRNRLANARGRLSRVLSTEWVRFRRSSWPTAEQALLGLLRNSAAFLTAPLYPNYRSSFQAASGPRDRCAGVNDMRNTGEAAAEGRAPGQKQVPTTELSKSGRSSRLLV